MKKIFFSLGLVSCFSAVTAQSMDQSKVPGNVKNNFSKDFHNAAVKWEKEKSNYEANFKMNGKSMSALYDEKGNKMETETDIKISDLPENVKTYIAENYKTEKIKEAAIITKADGEVNYEAEVKGMDVLFTKDGKFIRTAKD